MLTVTVAPASTRLALLADLRAELALSDDTADPLLATMLDAASAAIASYCQRTFAKATYTETVGGFGSTNLLLSRTPIVSVTSVTLLTDALTDWSIEDADAGLLYRKAGWDRTTQFGGLLEPHAMPNSESPDFTIVYVAGYDLPDQPLPTLPLEIQRACLLTAKSWYLNRAQDPARGVVTGVRMADGSGVTYAANTNDPSAGQALPGVVTRLLAPYRRLA